MIIPVSCSTATMLTERLRGSKETDEFATEWSGSSLT